MLRTKNFRTLFSLLALLGLAFNLMAPTGVRAAPGDPRILSGVVSDGTPDGHTWPLYARIEVSDGVGDPITVFTHPITGTYSVTLSEGTQYTLTVNAVQPGYQPLSQTVTVPANDLVMDFGLQVEAVFCEAQGYALVDHWAENFDGVSAPALPANWVSVNGGNWNDGDWVTSDSLYFFSANYPPQSGSNLVSFTESGETERLYNSSPIQMETLPNHYLTFWMFHGTGLEASDEFLQVQVSTDNGQTWTSVGQQLPFFTDLTGWQKHAVDLGAYASQPSLLLGFLADNYRGFSGSVNLDTISLGATCETQAGALLSGSVLDDNTGLTVDGVRVENGAGSTLSQATPLDAALGDGYYSLFVPTGADPSLAAAKIPYATLSETLVLTPGTVENHNIRLPAGQLAASPNPVALSLPMNASGDLTLTLANSGNASAEFILNELNPPLPPTQAPPPTPDPGVILSSFPSGLSNSWGIAYNPFTADLWLQDYRDNSSPIDDDQLVRFLSDGTYTGDAIALTHTSNYFAADMTFNPVTGSLWQPGRDRCIHEYDLTSRQPTGETICTPGNRTEALVYDPMTDTYIGSWVDQNTGQFSFLYRFGTDGAILETTVINWVIQGMAFNPANGHLITSGGSGGHPGNFQVLDANNHFSYVDSIWTPGFLNAPYGIDLACGGSLWVVVYDSPLTIYEIASGESGVCDWMDIPWLSESSPSSGTIAAMADQTVSLTFDAAGLMPGTYTAQLDVAHNTPYTFPRLPVSLTVTLAAGYGGLTGNVTAFERCAPDPVALPDALVEVLSGDTLLYTTRTDAAGQYNWASASFGEYTVRISADGYVTQTDTFPLVADLTATRDFALRSAAPCITSSTTSLSAEVDQNSTQIVNFTLSNSGAVSGDFELNELPAGGLPAAPAPELLLDEGFEAVAFPPSGWQEYSATNPAASHWYVRNWEQHSGAYSAHIPDEFFGVLNDWLLTPQFTLTRGTLSFWSMNEYPDYCKGDPDPCDLNVWLVVGAVGGDDDIFVGRAEDAWVTYNVWEQSTFDLAPLMPNAPVRIGFQFIGSSAGPSSWLDDVRLEGVQGTQVPWLSEVPLDGTIPANGGQAIAVTFDATGMEAGVYHAILRVRQTPYEPIDLPVTMTVTGRPLAQDQNLSTPVNTPLNGTLTATNPNGATLTFAQESGPSHGALAVQPGGSFTYTPNADYQGPDSFTFTVSDGSDTDSGIVSITVTRANHAPVAADLTRTTDEDVALTGALSATDADSDPLTFAQESGPSHGTVVIQPGGAFTYTPSTDYHGLDSFTFSVSDGIATDSGTVSITVTAVNDAPVAADLTRTTDEDVALTGALSATDADSDPLTFAQESGPSHGTLAVQPDGSFTYKPGANYHGPDSFTFSVSDGSATDSGTVSITVTPVNDAPVPPAIGTLSWQVGVEGSFSLPAFSDVDGDALSYTLTREDGSPLPAWLHFDAGTFTLTGLPQPGDAGDYLLKVTALDSNGGSAHATFSLNVAAADGYFVFIPLVLR